MPPMTIEGVLADHSKRVAALEESGIKTIAMDDLRQGMAAMVKESMDGVTKLIERTIQATVEAENKDRAQALAEFGQLPEKMRLLTASQEVVKTELAALQAKVAELVEKVATLEKGQAEQDQGIAHAAETAGNVLKAAQEAREGGATLRAQVEEAGGRLKGEVEQINQRVDQLFTLQNKVASDVGELAPRVESLEKAKPR